MRAIIKSLAVIACGVAAVLAGYFAFAEQPILVDEAKVFSGPMAVTIDEEGKTQVRNVYTVSSPTTGYLDRLELDEGDRVEKGQPVAAIHPLEPPFLDERRRLELVAALDAARSAVALAKVEFRRAQSDLTLSQSEYNRAAKLAETNVVSKSALEKAFNDLLVRRAQVDSAQANIEFRKAELETARARLAQPGDPGIRAKNGSCCVYVNSPINGVVLKIISRSEQAVQPGTKIIELGNARDLEIKVDLLSSDAVRIRQGAEVEIIDWGGSHSLKGKVRVIEPAGFTKVSALGIEEQRVNIIIDVPDMPASLGHGFRVFTRLQIWSAADVVQVPIGALFRSKGSWAVFRIEDEKAKLRLVEVEHMNDRHAEVKAGLDKGDTVVLYPNDELRDGSAIRARE